MAFCAILLSALVMTCEGLEQSRVPVVDGSTTYGDTTTMGQGNPNLSSQASTSSSSSNILQDHGTQSQVNHRTTEDLKKPQWPQETVMIDSTNNMSGNYSNTSHQLQINQNQNYAKDEMKNYMLTSHVFGTNNDTKSIAQNPSIADGKPVSKNNWGFPKNIPNIQNLFGGEKLTAIHAPVLQWHVGVYSKAFEPYMQICGGTLVTPKAVISAAHCFWSDLAGALPASQFVIAAGKLYRPWTDGHDLHAQKSEVSAVRLPPRFHGGTTSFQDDIAAVLLATAFARSPALRPLCVIFDEHLEYKHLRTESQGIVLGWGLTAENGPPAQALQYLYMPYVPIEECIANVESSFLKYITSDKICAGVTTGKALCRGDSGGGLVFFDKSSSERVPLLYGVASTAPRNEHLCNTHARATLTRVLAHRGFLLTHIPDIEEACAKNYISFGSDTKADLLEDRIAVMENTKPQRTKTKLLCNCHCNNNNSTKS